MHRCAAIISGLSLRASPKCWRSVGRIRVNCILSVLQTREGVHCNQKQRDGRADWNQGKLPPYLPPLYIPALVLHIWQHIEQKHGRSPCFLSPKSESTYSLFFQCKASRHCYPKGVQCCPMVRSPRWFCCFIAVPCTPGILVLLSAAGLAFFLLCPLLLQKLLHFRQKFKCSHTLAPFVSFSVP